MARGKGHKKYEWFENHVKLKWTADDNDDGGPEMANQPYSDSVYIDVAQCLSLLNRKLVRQGQIFRIRNMRFYTNDTSPNSTIKVGVIPRTWVTRNAWVKAKALWDKMNALAAEDVSGTAIYPKWHDFKVYMDYNHYTEETATGGDRNLLPVDFDDDAISEGEWVYSEFCDSGSDSDEYYVGMMDDYVGSTGAWSYVGLIQAYGDSRSRPQTSATMDEGILDADFETSPWARLFGDDDQTQQVLQHLDDKNDHPPYHRTKYIGGEDFDDGTCVGFTRVQSLNQTSGTGTFSLPSFNAPCGLIRVEWDAEEAGGDPQQPMHIMFDVDILAPMDA